MIAAIDGVNCALTGKIAQTLDGKGVDGICARSLWYAAIDTLYRRGVVGMNKKDKVARDGHR
ncbi:hypothetical protein [Dyella sp. M7H15-1]|uniref:hypothetical protein n=1 Tax=Dyella sp. M7H15-1 TaxID=2501295 RepID=UPI0013E8A2F0|nr:hypothetical protein [Dyella sp. M7H15-1]